MFIINTPNNFDNTIGRGFIGTAFNFTWGNIDNIAITSSLTYRSMLSSGNTGPGTQ